MIERNVFAHWMGMLSDRFGRELKAPTLRVYYDLLSEELDTNDFVAGCKRVMKRGQFFPAPQEIIDSGKPTEGGDLEALRAFRAIADGAYPHTDAIAREAMLLCGLWGSSGPALRDMAPGTQASKERQFLETYDALHKRARDAKELRALEAHTPRRPMLMAGDAPVLVPGGENHAAD